MAITHSNTDIIITVYHKCGPDPKDGSRGIEETWHGCSGFCPHCGTPGLFVENEPDNDVGREYLCIHCGRTCFLDIGGDDPDSERTQRIIRFRKYVASKERKG